MSEIKTVSLPDGQVGEVQVSYIKGKDKDGNPIVTPLEVATTPTGKKKVKLFGAWVSLT